MSVWKGQNLRRVGIGCAAASVILLAFCLIGAALIEKGAVAPEKMELICWIGYAAAGAAGGWIAGNQEKGCLVSAMSAIVLWLLVTWLAAWCLSRGLQLGGYGWKYAATACVGAALAALAQTTRKGRGRRVGKTHAKRGAKRMR